MKTFLTSLMLLFLLNATAQNIKVKPYIQHVLPNSVTIMWETDGGEESVVDWGDTEMLGNFSSGTANSSQGANRIHTVQINGLERFTKYYYRVRTGTAVSEIHQFKTPPFASDGESFRFAAMSDMQRDNANPNKWDEIVHDGVLDYLNEEYEGDLSDELALVLIPGDLVVNGLIYSQWEEHFFDPSAELFTDVPVYPVPGNHELNSSLFFRYFRLPNNGTDSYEEHWWYHDYGNIRIIGLDSNTPFDNQAQLTWLENTLYTTALDNDIDFVFAQLHHPHKSEMWLPGESDFTGEVVTILENFSQNSGKPSVHFFGHTHGYSRGQSRDHKHLWINVATAGGAIDNWGEFAQADYPEFSVSYDEWGFVMVDVIDGENPHFIVRRLSRGDDDQGLDNVLRDSLVVRRYEQLVDTPQAIFPINTDVSADCVELMASDFIGNASQIHGQSHWQLSLFSGNFSDPVFEHWENYENIYGDIDTQAGEDLFTERVYDLEANEVYKWRVRYRDRELNWSDWSEEAVFTTVESESTENLLINGNAESGAILWEVVEGSFEALSAGECNGTEPFEGLLYFVVGGLCNENAFGRVYQNVDISEYADEIEQGTLSVTYGGYLSNWGGDDVSGIQLFFLDNDENELDSTDQMLNLNSNWTLYSNLSEIPEGTTLIRMELTGTRNSGADNDSYFDELYLRLVPSEDNCSQFSTGVENKAQGIRTYSVQPNPLGNSGVIVLGDGLQNVEIQFFDVSGRELQIPYSVSSDRILLNSIDAHKGMVIFRLSSRGEPIGSGRFIIE